MVFDCRFDDQRQGSLPVVAADRNHTVTSEQVFSGVCCFETMRTTLTLSEMEVGLWVLAAKLRKMGFTPSKADLDLWIGNSIDGSYKPIAPYMDDIVVMDLISISHLTWTTSL
jgi:hypothetical protein